MKKNIVALISLIFTLEAWAHCPARYKAEKACFMLDQNTLYIYDESVEHNGPYKDLKGTLEVEGLKSSRIARGIVKIESPSALSKVTLSITDKKSVMKLTVNAEK